MEGGRTATPDVRGIRRAYRGISAGERKTMGGCNPVRFEQGRQRGENLKAHFERTKGEEGAQNQIMR
jgi:hypothetical protein